MFVWKLLVSEIFPYLKDEFFEFLDTDRPVRKEDDETAFVQKYQSHICVKIPR